MRLLRAKFLKSSPFRKNVGVLLSKTAFTFLASWFKTLTISGVLASYPAC